MSDKFKQHEDSSTEKAIIEDLSEELLEAFERLRETASQFGEQRIYAATQAIKFCRQVCYFFVRPRKKMLQVWFYLGRTIKSPIIRKTRQVSIRKVAHQVQVTHRDQVEPPLTDWLKEAFDTSGILRVSGSGTSLSTQKTSTKPRERARRSRPP
jgi:hypothetical protein